MKIGRSKARVISELTIDQDIAMLTYKLTGLGAGSGDGHSIRHQQLPTSRTVAFGTYTGNGVDDRQITVGFKCSMVIAGQSSGAYLVLAKAVVSVNLGVTGAKTDLLLHATDGFVVDDTSMNVNAGAYHYWAISE